MEFILNNLSFTAADNFNLPIIITDADGIVIYKNKSAQHSLKRIRRSANIARYISDRRNKSMLLKDSPGIRRFFHDGSIYTNAFAAPFDDEGRAMWIWIFSLYFNDIEDPGILEQKMFRELSDCIIDYIKHPEASSTDKSPIDIRFNEALFRILRTASISFNANNQFRVYDVITSICRITHEASKIYGKKLMFDTAFLDPSNYTNIPFEGFANLFMHALVTSLRISNFSPMEISFSQFSSRLFMSLYFITDVKSDVPSEGRALSELFPLFPGNRMNLLALDTIASFYEFNVEYTFEHRDGRQFLELVFSAEINAKEFLLKSPNETVRQLLLNICKINYTQKLTALLQTF